MNKYKQRDNFLFRLLDNYFNRIYIYNLQRELFYRFNHISTCKNRIVHLEVQKDKRGYFYGRYTLLYKIGDELVFTHLEVSKNKDGLINLINYKENLEYFKGIIEAKLSEVN